MRHRPARLCPVSAILLRPVKRGVGGRVERIEIVAALRGAGDANADGRSDRLTIEFARGNLEIASDPLGDRDRGVGIHAGQQCDEFLSTNSPKQVERAQRMQGRLGEQAEHGVAGTMPKDGVTGRRLVDSCRFWVLRFRLMVKRGPWSRPQASEGEAQHGAFCWTRRFGQGHERLHCG
jgi:hypothetical protein